MKRYSHRESVMYKAHIDIFNWKAKLDGDAAGSPLEAGSKIYLQSVLDILKHYDNTTVPLTRGRETIMQNVDTFSAGIANKVRLMEGQMIISSQRNDDSSPNFGKCKKLHPAPVISASRLWTVLIKPMKHMCFYDCLIRLFFILIFGLEQKEVMQSLILLFNEPMILNFKVSVRAPVTGHLWFLFCPNAHQLIWFNYKWTQIWVYENNGEMPFAFVW